MTDERGGGLISRADARRRALMAAKGRAAEPEAAARDAALRRQLDAEEARDRLQSVMAVHALHDLLRDLAAYLGDRPQKDADAMALYGRVIAMLGGKAE